MPIIYFLPNSSKKLCSQIISFAASVATTYSAFVVDITTIFCRFEAQDIVVPPKINTNPVVLFLLSISPVKLVSTNLAVAAEVWDMVFGLFGVSWVMPSSVVGLFACWQGHFGRLRNGVIWKIVPPCLMWCIWKERNNRCFEDAERTIPDIKLLFFRTLLEWFSDWRNHSFSFSLLDLLDFCNFRS